MATTVTRNLFAIDGPPPRAPEYSITTVADRLLAAVTPEGGFDEHWANGVDLWPYPSSLPSGDDPCNPDGSLNVKDEPVGITLPDGFESFTAYLGDVCTARSIGSWAEFTSRANAALAARIGWALERQLIAAEFATSNPHLGDGDVDILSEGVSPKVGLSLLEDAIAATGIAGIILLAPGAVASLGFERLTTGGGVLRTAAGTRVVSAQGLVGAETPSGGSDAGVGESWSYACGPVVYQRSDQVIALPATQREAMAGRLDNTAIYRAELDAVIAWDKTLQAAVLIDETA